MRAFSIMRLKTLELKGFKSFANDTTLHFSSDVTGVVGPNGSGKSNIVDAVRWVLGEQKSSQLRLDKMTSVIFNGTKKRKEAQAAQVTLIFENTQRVLPTDFHQVAVTRMLYRSGESEYRLNGVTCRLKDITTLFLDTGIGPDSYAIIALGMVEDLLSDREHSRRRMFEQAAGISKYKARKHETQQKLEATSADLERVEDLLFEIEDQLKKLEKQAQRTQKFYEIKDEYKQRSIALAIHHLAKHKKNYQRLETTIRQEEDQYRAAEIESRQLEAETEALRKTHTDRETSLSGQQQAVNQLTGRIRSKENEKNMLAQKRGFLEQDMRRVEDQLARSAENVRQLEQEIVGYQTDLNYEKTVELELEEALEKAKQQLEKARQEHNLLKGNVEGFAREQQQLERTIADLERQKAVQRNQIDNLRRSVERTLADVAARRADMDAAQSQLDALTDAETRQQTVITGLLSAEAQRTEQVAHTEKELETLTRTLTDHRRQLDAKRNEYKLTKSMVESMEGFPESIQFLSKQKEWSKSCPLLSDLIYVQETYRVAIENYLEPYLNYYVVPDVAAAVQAIQLLGKSQKGRANFFILDAFRAYTPPLTLSTLGTRAVEVVEVEAQYRPIIEYLLEDVVVVDQHAPEATLFTENDGTTVLSTAGTVQRKRFSMAGGSVGLFEGKKIGRKKNVELLEIDIKKIEAAESAINERATTVRAHLQALKNADQTARLTTERQALSKIQADRAGIQARLDNIAAFVRNFDAQAAESGQAIEQLEKSITALDTQLTDQQANAAALRERLSNADGSFRNVAEQLNQYSQAYNQQNVAFIRQQNKVNVFQQELGFRQKRLQELHAQTAQNQSTRARTADEIGVIVSDLTRLEQELRTGYAEKKEKEAELNAVEQSYFQVRNDIHARENNLRERFRQQQERQSNINRLKEQFQDVKFDITAIGERLRAEFGMSVNEVFNQEPDTQYTVEGLEKDVNALKRRIDTYGEINPLAVEAYNEIKARYDTIAAQRADVLSAKENLLETMKAIEETATARFLESFEQVRTNFTNVFRTLFTEEDTADLVLTNPDSPLDSDINIIAKPKGKRPQSIAQLSGGEKTLTATALLFALYLLKPAPFCIFDEVDAPLDDANVEKFNKIIRKFSADSQFIVVTHNKATMAAVDTIYGVYMPEQGVSAVTPVDFRKLNHEALIFEG